MRRGLRVGNGVNLGWIDLVPRRGGASDTTPPTVTITSTESSPTGANPIPITITFNEDVTGFAVGDLTLGNCSAGDFVAVSAKVYTANLTPTAEAVTVDIAQGVCVDGAGNGNAAATQFSIASYILFPRYMESNNGTDLVQLESLTGWTQEAGTMELDTTNFLRGSASIKVTNPGGSSAGGRIVATINWTPGAAPARMRFYFYCYDVSKLFATVIRIYNAGGGYMDFTDSNYINGWNAIDIYPDDWVANGTVAWTDTFTAIRLLAAPIDSVVVTSVSFDGLLLGIANTPAAIISFDDGYASDLSIAYAYMQPRHAFGTSYVISGQIDGGGSLTSANLQTMDAAGWNIGNHTSNGGADYATCATFLAALNLTHSPLHAAYTGGSYSSATKAALVALGIHTGRHTKAAVYPCPSIAMANGYEIGSRQISTSVSLATAKGYVDAAIAGNYIVGFFFHKLVASGATGNEWNQPDFEDLIDYIIASGLQFVTINNLYDAASGPVLVRRAIP